MVNGEIFQQSTKQSSINALDFVENMFFRLTTPNIDAKTSADTPNKY